MNSQPGVTVESDIKRVGKSGQISIGKQYAGQYFREQREENGAIILVPVVVVARSHWSVRDQTKIRTALAWAAANPAKETGFEVLAMKAKKRPGAGTKRGR
jgi:hypothetical protein